MGSTGYRTFLAFARCSRCARRCAGSTRRWTAVARAPGAPRGRADGRASCPTSPRKVLVFHLASSTWPFLPGRPAAVPRPRRRSRLPARVRAQPCGTGHAASHRPHPAAVPRPPAAVPPGGAPRPGRRHRRAAARFRRAAGAGAELSAGRRVSPAAAGIPARGSAGPPPPVQPEQVGRQVDQRPVVLRVLLLHADQRADHRGRRGGQPGLLGAVHRSATAIAAADTGVVTHPPAGVSGRAAAPARRRSRRRRRPPWCATSHR